MGIWAREESLTALKSRKPAPSQDDARKKLSKLSESWDHATDLLWSMFINPMAEKVPNDRLDPDYQPVEKVFPRSAILFGPPGTGKTTLVRSAADVIGWDYVELHPSHFVADGLPNVQRTADLIFKQLMELDHTMVLFDEVDELVRERDIEPDQFGRFLTTSMLPRLAELWKARKIMYFVATNHIEYSDRAVTRSERFDAIVYIGPPSFEAKKKRLLEIINDRYQIEGKFDSRLTEAAVKGALPTKKSEAIEKSTNKEDRDAMKAVALPKEFSLSKFALLRWDELDELATELEPELRKSTTITQRAMKAALGRIKDAKSRTLGEYHRFAYDRLYERYDASKVATWVVTEIEGLDSREGTFPKPVKKGRKNNILQANVGSEMQVQIPGFKLEKLSEGKIRLRKSPTLVPPG